jgi:hypothetical protein
MAPSGFEGGIKVFETPRGLQPIESLYDLRTPVEGEIRPGAAVQLPRDAIEMPRAGAEKPGFTEKLKEYLTNPEVLGKLGVAAMGAFTGARTAKQAAAQGRQAKAETQAIAQPYITRGQELVGRAERGELTPANAQAYQAAQAETSSRC